MAAQSNRQFHTRPTQPELLDWLGSEFQSRGWSMKQMVRLVAMPATYRQSANARPELTARDRDNTLLARQPRLRLPAEEDPVLCLSNPPASLIEMQRATLDTLKDLNEEHYSETGDLKIASRISSDDWPPLADGGPGTAGFFEGVA